MFLPPCQLVQSRQPKGMAGVQWEGSMSRRSKPAWPSLLLLQSATQDAHLRETWTRSQVLPVAALDITLGTFKAPVPGHVQFSEWGFLGVGSRYL